MALELDDSFLFGDEAQTVETPTETLDDSFLFAEEEPIAEPIAAPEIVAEAPGPERIAEPPIEQPAQIKPLEQPEEDEATVWGLMKKGFFQSQAAGDIQSAGRISEEIDSVRKIGSRINPSNLKYPEDESQKLVEHLKGRNLLDAFEDLGSDFLSFASRKTGDKTSRAGLSANTISQIANKDKAVALEVADTILDKYADDAIDNLQKAAAISESKALTAISKAEDFSGAISAFADAPIDTIVDALASSAYPMAEVMATGAAGAPLGAPGFIAGTYTGSFNVNYKSKFMEILTQEGVDLSNKESIKKALQDRDLIKKANKSAFDYSAPIAFFDAASGGIASKTLAATKLRNSIAQTGVQMSFGAGGEAVGQISETGEVSSPGEVLVEGIAEAPGGIIEPMIIGKDRFFEKDKTETFDQGGAPPELFTPTHKAGGGQDAQIVTKNGEIVPDTYINAEGNVFRDSNAVPVTPDAGDVSMDVNAVAGAIKAEIFGEEAAPGPLRKPEIDAVMKDISKPAFETKDRATAGIEPVALQPEPTLEEAPRGTIPQVPDEVLPVTPSLDDRRLTGVHGRVEERRADIDHRRELAAMSEEEKHAEIEVLRKERVTDKLTGINNQTAYQESERLPHQVFLDVDDFKNVNDRLTYEGADLVLAEMGKILKEESDNLGIPARLHGDEFVIESDNPQHAEWVAKGVQERLANTVIEFTLPDGTVVVEKGIGVSFGIADTLENAEAQLKKDKAARKAAGLREGVRRDISDVLEAPAERKQDIVGEGAAKAEPLEVEAPVAAPVTPPKKYHKTVDKRFGEFVTAVDDLGSQLVEGGGIALIPDPKFKAGESDKPGEIPQIRTKSQNPSWFQSLASEEKATVAQIRNAIDAAKSGKFLGKKQQRIVTTMIDEIVAREERQAEQVAPKVEPDVVGPAEAEKPKRLEPVSKKKEEVELSPAERLLSKFYSPKEIADFKQETSKLSESEVLEFYEKKYDEGKRQAEKPKKLEPVSKKIEPPKRLEPVSKKKVEPEVKVEPKAKVKPVEPKPEVKPITEPELKSKPAEKAVKPAEEKPKPTPDDIAKISADTLKDFYSQRPANIGMSGNELTTGDFVQRDTPISIPPKKSVGADSLTKLVNIIQRDNPGTRKITFHIRATQAEAFGVNSVAENGIIKGGFYAGTNDIVLIAENIKDIADAFSVIRHEAVGHYGLRQLLNEEGQYDKLLQRVYDARSDELKAQYDWVAKAYPELVAQNDVRKIADEMLAHAAETKTKSNLLTKIYDAIIKLLNKLGLVLDTISHKEVNALIRLSEANLRKDIRPQVYQQPEAFYRADDVAPDMFYSQLEEHLAEKLPKSGTPAQYRDTIKAFARKGQIKAEELEWSGANEWLDEQTGKVTKNDMIDFIRANRIRVDEVVKGGLGFEGRAARKEILIDKENAGIITEEELADLDEIEALDARGVEFDDETKFAQHVLPGGEKYRELLLTLPDKKRTPKTYTYKEAMHQIKFFENPVLLYLDGRLERTVNEDWRLEDAMLTGKDYSYIEYLYPIEEGDYKGGHYEEPNVLAHIRFNERTDADGKRVLFVEEIQSDFHQEGRKKGYLSKAVIAEFEKLNAAVAVQLNKIMTFKGERLYENKDFQKIVDARDEALEKRDSFKKEHNLKKTAAGTFSGVPDAPFKTTWPLLAMKRVIRHAAENNFDSIAWTTGEQQAARYDLSKQLDRVEYWGPMANGKYGFSAFKPGNEGIPDIKKNNLSEKEIEDNLGKDITKKIIDGEGATEKVGDTQYGELSGLDLKVGGEGMKGFYDNILPKTVNKYVKKWGGKVGETKVSVVESDMKDPNYMVDRWRVFSPEGTMIGAWDSESEMKTDRYPKEGQLVLKAGEPASILGEKSVHSLDITDKMRTAAMEGQPLFAKKPMDANDPRVLFSRAADDTGNAPVGQSLGMPEEGKKDLFVRLAQDSFNRIKTMQETILKKGGTIRTESDVYLAEERSSSKISYELKAFENKYQKPLIDLMGDKNLEPEEVDLYVIAKHAQERNEYIASINDDMQDGGSGMTTQQAKDILAEFENKRTDLEAAAQIIYDANNQTLDTLVKEGHMKEEAANELRERWDYYVPLKGKDGEDYKLGTGVGYNIAGSQFKHAMGRGEGNLPESPTAHSFAQAETAIVRTEKSRIGKALVELVRANPDPDFWSIGQRTYKQFEDLYGTPFEGYEDQPPPPMVNNIDYKKVMAITPEERALAKKEGRKPKAKAVYKLDQNYKHRPDVFSVMVEGEELLIKIEDRIVMEQLTKANATQLNAIVRGFGKVNRYLAMVNTGLNLEFVLGNFERDIQTAIIHLSGEQSAKIALKVVWGTPSAMRGIWQGVFDTKGKSEYRQLWDEMQAEGGAIGFFGLEDIETKVKHLQNKLKRKHGVLGTTKRGVLLARDLILDANLAVENGVRLSAYKETKEALIANGMPVSDAKAKAATIAKNLTVNFNRKGEWAPVFNSLWLFSSVSIQGSARIIYSLAKYKRTRQIVAGIATTAFFNAMYNMGSGDDDDGIPYWDKVSDYEKQTNIIFMHPDGDNEVGTGGGGRYFKYRMPYGYNIFHYTGLTMHDLMFNERATAPKTTIKLLGAVLNAYNPIQGADLLDTITPTIAKPFEQDKRNINFMGGGIRPDYIFDQYDRPSSQKFFGSTNKYLVDAFVSLNELTGGDETHPGWWDWSPQTVKHYTGWLTGGAGMFAQRVVSGGINLATGEEIETRNIPFIRSMVGKPSARFDSERYYEAIKQAAAVKAQLKLYKGTDRWSEYRQDNYEVHRLAFRIKGYKNKIKRLRDQRDKAYVDDDRDLAKEKTEEIRLKMMEFSMMYDDAIAAQEY